MGKTLFVPNLHTQLHNFDHATNTPYYGPKCFIFFSAKNSVKMAEMRITQQCMWCIYELTEIIKAQ